MGNEPTHQYYPITELRVARRAPRFDTVSIAAILVGVLLIQLGFVFVLVPPSPPPTCPKCGAIISGR